jgi:ethanolamine utilization microcompartment shell protein EutS
MSRQQSAHHQTHQVRLFRSGNSQYHDERTCPVCSAAHSQLYGDVISSVPPQLQGQQTLPSGRNASLAVNPADVQGNAVIIAPGIVPVSSAANLGGGTGTQGIFADKSPQGVLEFRNITPGAGIDFTIGALDDIIINSSLTALTGLANEGTGTGLVFDTVVGTTAYLRSLQVDPTAGNQGIAITTTGQVINIGNTLTGGNLGTGAGTLFASKTAPGVLNFNSLAGGLGISVSAPASNVVTVASTLTGQSIATGLPIYAGQVGASLQFKGLLAGVGITLSSSATDVTITSSIAATAVLQGGNSFGTTMTIGTNDANPLVLRTNSVTALTLSTAQAASFANSITAGVNGTAGGSLTLNGATGGGVTINVPASGSAYTLTWPGTQGGAGTVLTNNGSGVLSWQTNPDNFFAQGGNAFGAPAVLGTTDLNSLALETNSVTALTISASQQATFAKTLTVSGATVTIGGVGAGGSLILNGSTSGAFTQAVPAAITSYSVTWPAAQATAIGQVLINNGSGILSWGVAGAGTFYQQGGNAFGAAATLGTTDANSLTLVTSNIAALSITSAQQATFAKTLTVSGASVTVGTAGTVGGTLVLAGSTSGTFTQAAPASIAAPYTVTWPSAAASANGSYLASSTAGALSWNSPNGGAGVGMFLQGGNSFGATATLGTNDANSLVLETNGGAALTITSAKAATFASTLAVSGASLTVGMAGTVGGSLALNGLTSGTFTQQTPATVTTYAITWPAAQATAAGQVLVNNGSGALTWGVAGGGTFYQQGGNSFGAAATLGTNDNFSLALKTNGTAALSITNAQAATFANTLAVSGASITVGASGTVGGSLILNGSTLGALTQNVPAAVTSYSITWPAAQASAAGQVLTNNGSGALSWATPGNFFAQGGNSFGTTATLGTNDANSLVLETNGAAALTISSSQVATFASTLAVQGALLTVGVAGTTGGSLVLAGSIAGTLTQQVPATVTTYAVTWPAAQGAASTVLTNNGSGGLSWAAAVSPSPWSRIADATTSENQIVYNTSLPTAAIDNWLAGPQTTEGASTRAMMINSSTDSGTGSFRAGTVNGTQWNQVNRGAQSVAFGLNNTASGAQSGALSGSGNTAAGAQSVVAGGTTNSIAAAASGAAVIAGTSNQITTSSATYAIICGGSSNSVTGGQAAIIGGVTNTITGGTNSFIGGGNNNSITGSGSFIGAGDSNQITGAIANAAIGGGQDNTASANGACVPGGTSNTASGVNSFACGTFATASLASTFVFNDGVNSAFVPPAANTFSVAATGGLYATTSITSGSTNGTTGSLVLVGNGNTVLANALTQTVPTFITAYTITWPNAVASAAGSYLASDTGGTLSWNSPNGGAGIGVFLQGGNSFGGTATLGTNDANSLVLETNGAAALTITSAKAATFASTLVVQGASITVGVAGTTSGSLVLAGSTAGALTQNTPATVATYSMTWPGAVASASGSYLASSTGGILSWNNPNGGAGVGMFLQGGNAFGTTATLGTTDGNSLILQTNSITALTISNAQQATFAKTLTVAGASVTIGTAGTTGGSLIMACSSSGNLTQLVPATIAAPYSVTWPTAQAASAGEVLTNDGTGILSWTAGSASSFVNGGNAFAGLGPAVLGTTNTFALVIKTNSITALTIANTQTATFASTVTVSGASVTIGTPSSTSGSIILACSGSANTATIAAPASVSASYSVTWPAAQGGAGTVLTNNGSGSLTWATAGAGTFYQNGGNAFGAAATIGLTDTNQLSIVTNNVAALVISSAQQASFTRTLTVQGASATIGVVGTTGGSLVLAGSTSGTVTQQVPATAITSYTVTWPAAVATAAGSYLASTTGGVLSWNNPNGGTGVGTFLQGGNSFSATAVLGTNDLNPLQLRTNGTTAVAISTTQATTFSGSVTVNNGLLTSGVAGTAAGTLILAAGTAGSFTQTTPATISTPYTLTWPAAAPTVSGQALTVTTAGVASWTSVWAQGGNSFGAAGVLGTNDANSLTIQTNGVAALTLTSTQAATFSKTLTVQGASLTIGVSGTTGGSLVLAGAGGGTFTQNVPAAAISTYAVTWPAAVATAAGSYLASTTGGVLSWNNPNGGTGVGTFLQGGNSFGATAILGTKDANSLELISANSAALTFSTSQAATFTGAVAVSNGSLTVGVQGSTTGTLFVASSGPSAGTLGITVPSAVATYTLTMPGAVAAASGSYLASTTGGVLSWNNPNGGAGVGMFLQGGNSFGGTATLGTNDANSLVLETNGGAALTITSAKAATFASTLVVSGASLTVGVAGTTGGSVILAGAAAGAFMQNVPATVTTYSVTWPTAVATAAGSYLASTTGGVLSWNSPNGGAGVGVFLQGGNSFGATATLGTNDANSLVLKTNNITALTIATTQVATFASTVTVSGASLTVGVAGTTGGSLILAGSTAGTLMQNVPTTVTTYSMTWPGAVAAASGSYLASTTGGILSWNSPNGGAGVGMFLQGGNSFGATATLGTNDANNLVLKTNNVTALTITSAAQAATFAGTLTANGGVITAGVAGTTAGSLVLAGSTAGALTQNVPATVTSYAATWPAAQGSGALFNNGAGVLSWVMPAGYGYLPAVARATLSSTVINTTTTYMSTGLSVTITPQFTNSLIKVTVSGALQVQSSNSLAQATLARGLLDLATGVTPITTEVAAGGVKNYGSVYTSSSVGNTVTVIAFTIVDAPATVSPTTYTVYFAPRTAIEADWGNNNTTSTIIAEEILVGPMVTGGPPSPLSTQVITTTGASTSSVTYVSTGMAATITPQYGNSKVFITLSGAVSITAVSAAAYFTIARGTVDLATGISPVTGITPQTSTPLMRMFSPSTNGTNQQFTITFLDSPATTAAITYTVYYAASSGITAFWLPSNSSTAVLTLQEEFVGTPGQGASTTAPARAALNAVSVTTSATAIGSLTYTFPTLGGPYRAFAQYNVVNDCTIANSFITYVSDGTNTFAGSQQLNAGAGFVDGGLGSGISSGSTYAAGQTVTFTVYGISNGNTVTTFTSSFPVNAATASYMIIYSVPA